LGIHPGEDTSANTLGILGSMVFMIAYGVLRNYKLEWAWMVMALIKSIPAQYLNWSVS